MDCSTLYAFVSQVKLQELNKVTRYETKRVVLCLIARNLAEWVVRGTLAREIDPPKIQDGWKVRGSFKNLQELGSYATKAEEFTVLPASELPGLKFEEPYLRRRGLPPCGLMGNDSLNLVSA